MKRLVQFAAVGLLLTLARNVRADPIEVHRPALALEFDAGGALLAPSGAEPWDLGVPFGVRFGSAFPNGFSAALRYDNLGLRPNGGQGTPWQLIALNLRYTFTDLAPEPFVELSTGLALVSADVPLGPGAGPLEHDFGIGLGAGIAIPIHAHLHLDLAARGFLSPALQTTLRAVSLEVGLELAIEL